MFPLVQFFTYFIYKIYITYCDLSRSSSFISFMLTIVGKYSMVSTSNFLILVFLSLIWAQYCVFLVLHTIQPYDALGNSISSRLLTCHKVWYSNLESLIHYLVTGGYQVVKKAGFFPHPGVSEIPAFEVCLHKHRFAHRDYQSLHMKQAMCWTFKYEL